MHPLLIQRLIQEGAVLPDPAGAAPPRSFGDTSGEASAALSGCVVAARPDLEPIRMRGKDRLDFLHRLSTNDIVSLKRGEGTFTALLNTRGRILDLLQALARDTDLLLVPSPSAAGKVREWLEAYLFREEVALESPAVLSPCLGLYGAASGELLERMAGGDWRALPPCHHRATEIGGVPILAARSYPLGGSGFLLLAEGGESLLPVWEAVRGAGARPAGSQALERLRVASGVPGADREISEAYNPWEAGLDAAVSLQKGCYLGQEVVARLHNYRKVQRRLAALRLEGPPPSPGSPVLDEHGEEELGLITSAEPSPAGEGASALAILGVPQIREGRPIRVPGSGGPGKGWIVPLPSWSAASS